MPRKILTRFGVNQLCWFMLIALLPLTIAGTVCYFFVKGQIKRDVVNELKLEARAIQHSIASIIGENLARIADFSSDGFIRDSTKTQALPGVDAETIRKNLNRHLEVNKRSLNPNIIEVFVVDTAGKVVASTSDGQIGKDVSEKQYFKQPFLHFEQTGPLFSKEEVPAEGVGEPDLVFSTLLTDKLLHTPIGVIANRVSIGVLLSTMMRNPNNPGEETKLGSHDHIYISNKDNFILAASDNSEGSHLRRSAGTPVIEKAFTENRTVIDTYKNPWGHRVLGVAVPVEETGWVILAERDYKAAFAPLGRIRNLFIILNSSAALMAFLVSFFVSKNVSTAVKKLKDGTETVARGDLDHKIELKRKDELKDLSLSFNTMTKKLKDYTEEKTRREEELRKFKFILDSAGEEFYLITSGGELAYANEAAASSLGYAMEEMLRLRAHDFDPIYNENKFHGQFKMLKERDIPPFETMHRTKSGKIIPKEVKAVYLKLGDKEYVCAFARDISERKRAEEELRKTQKQLFQAEKMSSLGTLASGIAHEVNNPLSYIMNNIELVKDYIGEIISVKAQRIDKEEFIPALEEMENCLEDAKVGTEQIRKIISAVYEFSHPGQDKLDYVDINKTIEGSLKVVWHELKRKAKITKDFSELPKILCYPHYLVQVFTNLFLNAANAIPESGEIRVKTYRQGQTICIEISDTGVGIPEENLKRIFDPFFTTKDVGKGTGLGLSIVYNLVTQAEGSIEAASAVGKGTTFKITLPLRTESDISPT